MTESTARAERIKPLSSAASSFIWEVAQKPVSVCLPHGLIDRLEKEVVDNFRSLTSRGSEIGGLLLGAIAPGNPSIVSIDDFELIPCDYSRGPLYRLSDADMGRFERAVEDRDNGNGPIVVGYFRSHTRKGLSLDAEDVAFLEARFRDPSHIALLVRPYATKASTAGIFIREGGALRGESSYLEFPFRSSQLTTFRPAPQAVESPAPAPPAVAPASLVAGPVPAAPKASARAQIVPIASRREMNLPAPPPAAEPPAREPVADAEPPKPLAEVPRPAPVAAIATPVEAPKPAVKEPVETIKEKPAAAVEKPIVKVEKPIVKVEKPIVKVEKPVVKTEPAAEPADPEKRRTGLVIGVVAAIGLILVSLFVYPGFLRHGSIPIPGQNIPSLSLRVERTGTDILLTWNRDSEVVKTAQHAVLSIFDGDRHENYDMDMGQLRNGSIVYSPITADVSFRMDVVRPGKAAPISESVRVLRTRPSPMGDGSQQAQVPQVAKPGVQPAPKAAQPADAAVEEAVPAEETKLNTVAKPTRAFDASSLVQRLRPPTPSEVLDAPTINPGGPATPGSLTGLNLNGAAPAPSAPVTAVPASTVADKKGNVNTGGQIKQAELITRKEPEYPKLARQMGVKGVVELTATIGIDGRVKSVKVEKGHPLLSKAASEAVMQWVYKPTLLNGQPVQNDTHISFNFLGER